MAEPWDITSAFAQQLMRQAAAQDANATELAMAPINQAMAMERLKQHAAIELANLPQKLAFEDQVRQLQEQRAERRRIAEEGRQEETTKRAETRAEERLPRTLEARSKAKIGEHVGDIEAQIPLIQKYGKELYEEAARRSGRGGSVEQPLRPPLKPGANNVEILPNNSVQREMFIDDLKAAGHKVIDTEGYRGHNWVHYKSAGSQDNPKVQSVPSPVAPSAVSSSAATQPREAAPKVDKTLPPRPASSIPFEDTVPMYPNVDLNQQIPNAPIPPRRPVDLGGKDTQAFLYESIRRRGYSDDEANQILADLKKPKVTPTDDPDIFDVLVA